MNRINTLSGSFQAAHRGQFIAANVLLFALFVVGVATSVLTPERPLFSGWEFTGVALMLAYLWDTWARIGRIDAFKQLLLTKESAQLVADRHVGRWVQDGADMVFLKGCEVIARVPVAR